MIAFINTIYLYYLLKLKLSKLIFLVKEMIPRTPRQRHQVIFVKGSTIHNHVFFFLSIYIKTDERDLKELTLLLLLLLLLFFFF